MRHLYAILSLFVGRLRLLVKQGSAFFWVYMHFITHQKYYPPTTYQKSFSFIDPYLTFSFIFWWLALELQQRVLLLKMNLNTYLLFLSILALLHPAQATKTVQSFQQLSEYHCQVFPIEGLYRLATGQLAQVYGKQYQELDCYIRQFVNKDGQDPYADETSQDQEEEGRSEEEVVPDIDPVVVEYAKGLKGCLPGSAEPVEAVYAIWRFVRFVVQHDYALEWIRAKIRATLGYQAEKPNAWMDGDQSAPRLRLDKLFSNQFYEYVDQLMFRSFLHPFLTFLNKNVVFAADGHITESGQPILVQYIQSKNIRETVFLPVIIQHPKGNIFSYTIPGIPLLLGGSTKDISWAFTGTLVDRSNIQQIQTLGNKFFHRDSEIWIKLQNVTHEIRIKDEEAAQCKYVHSNFGTLYEKHKSESGKVSEYITRWHEDEKKVRVIFSELLEVILSHGQVSKRLEFPFSSLVLTNVSGIHQYVCYQQHPSYFLYPDLAGAPEPSSTKWISNPKRHFLVVSNTHLTTHNQQSYIKREVHNPTEEQFLIQARRKLSASGKFTKESLLQFVTGLKTDPLIKKRKDLLIHIYRKAKFLFFPEEPIRKECDQLIAILQKWDNNLSSTTAPVFILWDYFFRDYTFNYVSSEPTGLNIAKHKIVTDVYWTGQMELWKVGTSYGECDSHEWENEYRKKLNGTGENSTCFFNIMRGINQTREVLRNPAGGIKEVKLSDFTAPKLYDPANGYLGTHVEEAFKQFFSKNLIFSAELGQNEVIYSQGYLQTTKKADITSPAPKEPIPAVVDQQL